MNNLYKKHCHSPQYEPRTHPRALRTPYRIRFQDPLLSENDLRGNLPGCRYPLANGNSIQYQTKSATILRQYLSGYLFYIEIYEVNALENFETAFIIESTQFFIFFMLEGGITFTDESERTMRHVQEQQFFPAYNRKGVYQNGYKKGKHRFVLISFDAGWYDYVRSDYSFLDDFYQGFQQNEKQYHIMPPCKINKDVARLLRKLHSQVNKGTKGEMEATLKEYVSKMIDYYNNSIGIELNKPSYKIKLYIDENFHDSELKINLLAETFFIEEQTLSRNFLKDYDLTPFAYLHHVRMQHAQQLLENTDYPIKEVGEKVGYVDTQNFGRKIKRAFNRTASAMRKAARKTKFWKIFH